LRRSYLDGTVTVMHADRVISISREVLDNAESWAYDGEVLTLDTAGKYRYRRSGDDPASNAVTFERI
jgi:hypothetical protein